MIYLASPYSSTYPDIVHSRFEDTMEFISSRIPRFPIFSPIVHCHELAKKYNLPTDAQSWQEYNESFLSRANKLWVLQLDGWQKSLGVRKEIDYWIVSHKKSFCIQYEEGKWSWLEYTKTG